MSRYLDARNYSGSSVQTHGAVHARVHRHLTVGPKPYTEATLLDDMINAHKYATNDQDREILLRTGGIGTARTRVSTIAAQFERGTLVRVPGGAYLQASSLAHRILELLPYGLTGVVTTAKLESVFCMIEDGRMQASDVDARLRGLIRRMFDALGSSRGAAASVTRFKTNTKT